MRGNLKDGKEFRAYIIKQGGVFKRQTGDHFVYKLEGKTISVPHKLNTMIMKRLKKEVDVLIVEGRNKNGKINSKNLD